MNDNVTSIIANAQMLETGTATIPPKFLQRRFTVAGKWAESLNSTAEIIVGCEFIGPEAEFTSHELAGTHWGLLRNLRVEESDIEEARRSLLRPPNE